MIFVVLGSQKFPFDRLLMALDDLKDAGQLPDDLVVQSGHSGYQPRSFAVRDFMTKDEFDRSIEAADFVICHGGTGAIVSTLKKGKKVLAVPRLSRYHEHVDDHQRQIVTMFSHLGLIEACEDLSELGQAIGRLREREYLPFESNTQRFLSELRQDIDRLSGSVQKPR